MTDKPSVSVETVKSPAPVNTKKKSDPDPSPPQKNFTPMVVMSIVIESRDENGKIEAHTEPFGSTEGKTLIAAHAAMSPHLASILAYRNTLRQQIEQSQKAQSSPV